MNNNIIQGFNGQNPGSWNTINQQGAAGVAINMTGNQLGSATQDLITYGVATASQITAIQNQAGAATGVLTMTGNDVRRIVHNVLAQAPRVITSIPPSRVRATSTTIPSPTLPPTRRAA